MPPPNRTYPTVTTGAGPDTAKLQVSEDDWRGDAQFTVSINGAQQGATYAAIAPHGSTQAFIFNGTFGLSPTLSVTYTNDAEGRGASQDRNLYVDSISYGGIDQNKTAALLTNGTTTFQLQAGGSPPPPPPPPPPPDATGFYISPNGSDTAVGTLAAPFQTIARAKQAMEQSATSKTTNILAGTYSIAAQPWTLNAQDAGQTWTNYPGAAVTIEGSGTGYVDVNGVNNLTIKGLTFQNLGAGPHGSGMYLNGSGETIRWNTFVNSHNQAISGSNLRNSLIDSNTVDGQSPGNFNGTANANSALQFWYGSSGNTISHNLIRNIEGGGIAFGAGAADPPNSNNVIDRNLLQNVDANVVDMGAIYIGDRTHSATGNKITNNVIAGNGGANHLTDGTKAIYLDDDTSNVAVTGNTIYGNAGQWAIQFHGGDHNAVQNNIFALSPGEKLGLYQDYNGISGFNGMAGNTFAHNIVYYTSTSQSPQWQWVQSSGDNGMQPPADLLNMYFSATASPIANTGQVVDASPVFKDPQFQNPGGGNFALAAGSPAYTNIGWETLPTDQGPLARP